MAKCAVKNDRLVIIEEITSCGDIRIERRGDHWNATPRQEGFGSGWAATRCGAVSGNVFADLGFPNAEREQLKVRHTQSRKYIGAPSLSER